jgi:hypothetical protein
MSKKYRDAKATLWIMAVITGVVGIVSLWLIGRCDTHIAAIVSLYASGKMDPALLKELLEANVQALYSFTGGLAGFSLLWLWTGYRLGKFKSEPRTDA